MSTACSNGTNTLDAAGRGIDRPDERDDQKQRVFVDNGKGHAGRNHEARTGQQDLAMIVPGSEEPDTYRQQRRAKERCRCDDAYLKRSKSEREQIDR